MPAALLAVPLLTGAHAPPPAPWTPAALDAFVLVFGLLIGSFLNVVIHRLPRDESIVSPGSRCPACGRAIAPWQNIPILSWLALRGRCAACSAPISARYPAVEAMTGLLFAAVAHWDGWSIGLPFHLAFVAGLVAVTFIDLDHQIIPNEITYPGVALGLLLALVTGNLADALIGAALGSGVLWGLGAAYHAVRKVEGMGGGDVKLAAMLGAFLGWKGIFLVIFLSSFVGAVAGVIVMRTQGTGRLTRIPYGTFLAPAAILVLFAGERLITWYATLLAR